MSFGFSITDLCTVADLASKLRKRFKSAPADFKATSQVVESLSHILRDLEEDTSSGSDVIGRDLSESQKDKLGGIIQQCDSVLKELQEKIDEYQVLDPRDNKSGNRARIIWKRLSWEHKDISELGQRISLILDLLRQFNDSDLREQVVDIKGSLKSRDFHTFTDWLSKTDYSAQLEDLIKRREEGTGQWFLSSTEYRKWLDPDPSGEKTERLLFCCGIPGAGKTIISSLVIENLEESFGSDSDVGIAYVFYSYAQQREQTSVNILCSLLQQLIRKKNIPPQSIKSLHQQFQNNRGRPSTTAVSEALEHVTSSYSRVLFVIDALDESATDERERLLREIFHIHEKLKAHVLVTSRDLPDIEKHFEKAPSVKICAKEEDVRKYLGNSIQQLPSHIQKDPEIQKELIEKVVKVSNGMFLLAQLCLDLLKYKTCLRETRIALENLSSDPEPLNLTYGKAIERIDSQPEEYQELAKRVLIWVKFARRPLTIQEFQHALAVYEGDQELNEEGCPDVKLILSVCTGLLKLDQSSGTLSFVHLTAQDYFQKANISWLVNGHTQIASTCLSYLSMDVFKDESIRIRQTRLKLLKYPFLEYAAMNWDYHAREASGKIDPNVAMTFLKDRSKTQFWYRIYKQPTDMRGFFSRELEQVIELAESFTPMHIAAYLGLEDVVSILFQQGIQPDEPDHRQRTPLSYAAQYGHVAVVERLLKSDEVDVNSQSEYGSTPLVYAVRVGKIAVVKMLLDHDLSNIEKKDTWGYNAFDYAIEEGDAEIVELFLNTGKVDVNSRCIDGETPLSFAKQIEAKAVVKLLQDVEALETLESDTAELEAGDLETDEPKTVELEASASETVDSKTSGQHTVEADIGTFKIVPSESDATESEREIECC